MLFLHLIDSECGFLNVYERFTRTFALDCACSDYVHRLDRSKLRNVRSFFGFFNTRSLKIVTEDRIKEKKEFLHYVGWGH